MHYLYWPARPLAVQLALQKKDRAKQKHHKANKAKSNYTYSASNTRDFPQCDASCDVLLALGLPLQIFDMQCYFLRTVVQLGGFLCSWLFCIQSPDKLSTLGTFCSSARYSCVFLLLVRSFALFICFLWCAVLCLFTYSRGSSGKQWHTWGQQRRWDTTDVYCM